MRSEKVEGTIGCTGFLIKCPDGKVRILTAYPLLSGAHPCVLVGEGAQEKTVEVKAVAAEMVPGIALLEPVKALPGTPLVLREPGEMGQGAEATVPGFPFVGKELQEISIVKTRVSSVQKDALGMAHFLRLGQEVDPSFCGSPVLDAQGRVVGMVSGDVNLDAATAIHADIIRMMFKGYGRGFACKQASAKGGRVSMKVEASLCDPLGNMEKVTVAFVRQEVVAALEKEPSPGLKGWSKAVPSMKEVGMTVAPDRREATANLEIERKTGDPDEVYLYVQVAFKERGEDAVWFPPQTVKVEFESAPVALPPPLPEPKGPKVAITLPDQLSLLGRVSMGGVPGDMLLSRDGEYLFLLDLSRGSIRKFEAETLKQVAEQEVQEEPIGTLYSRYAEVLFVLSGGFTLKLEEEPDGWGCIQTLDARDLRPLGTFRIPFRPKAFAETGSGVLAVSGTPKDRKDGKNLFFVSLAKKGIVDGVDVGAVMPSLHPHPDGQRLYYPIGCVATTPNKKGEHAIRQVSPRLGSGSPGPAAVMTSDGRFLVGSNGALMGLSASEGADMVPAGNVAPWQAIAVSPFSDTFLTLDAKGFLRCYASGGTKPLKSLALGQACCQLLVDPVRKRLYGITPRTLTKENSGFDLGDLVSFSWDGKALPAAAPVALAPGGGKASLARVMDKSGSVVQGIVRLTTFSLESSLGSVPIEIRGPVRLMRTQGQEFSVSIPGGTAILGKLPFLELSVETPVGTVTVPTESISDANLSPAEEASPVPAGATVPLMLKPALESELKGCPETMVLAPDGGAVYLLDKTSAHLARVDSSTMKVVWEAVLAAETGCFSVEPSGRLLVAASPHRVQVVDAQTGEITCRFDVEPTLTWIQVVSQDVLMAGTGREDVWLISAAKKAVMGKFKRAQTYCITPDPQPNRTRLSSGVIVFPVPPERAFEEGVLWYPRRNASTEPMILGRDGRHGVTPGGQVYHMGRAEEADAIRWFNGPSCKACAFLPGPEEFIVQLSTDGILRWGRLAERTFFRTSYLKIQVRAAQFDASGRMLNVLVSTGPQTSRLLVFQVAP